MKILATALALSLGLIAAIAPAEAARRQGAKPTVCFEQGCKGSHCIFCER